MRYIKTFLFLLILFIIPVFLFFIISTSLKSDKANLDNTPTFAIAIHGGAGFMKKESLNDEKYKLYIDKLNQALSIGINILENNGKGLDAVEKVINFLENDSLFNAGKGAVFTHEGKNELDASIMDGKTLNAGAVAGVTKIKNPISAARKVMENSKHVLLSGDGANKFAEKQGLEIVDDSYFFTTEKYNRLQKILKKEQESEKHGTVGCVVLDKFGNLAAGTSTGGMTNKMYGRIGDSPIIGAGTYANNNTCAVSCTGHGEYFIRYAVAHDVSALMEYKNLSLEEATNLVINKKLVTAGGAGGLISVDKNGNISLQFNTTSMFRASYQSNGKRVVKIFKD
ncbi:MAG: isoaspartyl peptidase/L-asparaginase [Chlorobi bacterium]|nr:isoaspartyl peptidase/L-asparaginase [Chlorobiota bacterium]